jgi:hypothetical protein
MDTGHLQEICGQIIVRCAAARDGKSINEVVLALIDRQVGLLCRAKYLWSSTKQRGPCTRAFPDPEAAILGGTDRRTEII